MKREIKMISWDEMSFMRMKHVYTVSNNMEFWKQSYETLIETDLTKKNDRHPFTK
jgi:hypothetical protein